MKVKCFLVCFIALIFVSFSITVRAADDFTRELKVKEDDRFVYILTTWNDDLAEDHLGSDDPEDELGTGAEKDKKFCYEVDDIDRVDDLYSWDDFTYVDGWIVELDYWGWTDDSSEFDEERDSDEIFELFDNSDDYGPYPELLFHSIVIPTPVDQHLMDYSWSSDYDCHNDSRVTYDVASDIRETREWGDDGVLKRITVKNTAGEIIYEILLDMSAQYWIIPIVGGIVGVSLIALVLASRNRNKKENLL